jgi:hypothetical protein
VNGTGSESCPIGFGISCVESSGSATSVLDDLHVSINLHHLDLIPHLQGQVSQYLAS